jgi:hypothetical protein
MSDQDPQKLWQEVLQHMSRESGALASIRPTNKAALLAALAAGGATHVVVTFDGCGDSGQIESVEARNGDTPIPLPKGKVPIIRVASRNLSTQEVPEDIEQALENFVYDVLRQSFPGWENNDGAFGEILFDVGKQLVVLDFNARYTDSEHFQQTF